MKSKWCWLATQTRQRNCTLWRLKLCVGASKTFPVRGLLCTMGDIRKLVGVGKTVFVHLADV